MNSCIGYRLANYVETESSNCVWVLDYGGLVGNDTRYDNNYYGGVRPVVSIPLNIPCSYADGIWTVEK